MRHKIIATAALVAVAGLTSSCGATATPVATPESTALASTAPADVAASTPASSSAASVALTARQVAIALKAKGLPVTITAVYTAATDPNHLLGRPGGYTSKIMFSDPRAGGAQTAAGGPEVTDGGSIEVFATHADAVRRAVYIETITQAAPLLGSEYDYVSGGVLLRVSGNLTPAQAAQYEEALQAVTGTPVVEPSPVST
jgi:hypothetical protein